MSSRFHKGVLAESVETLYASFDVLNHPDYYEGDEVNPYAFRCSFIPRTASYYIMVPNRDDKNVAMARKMMKGLAGRKKVREKLCTKEQLCYQSFANVGQLLVLWV